MDWRKVAYKADLAQRKHETHVTYGSHNIAQHRDSITLYCNTQHQDSIT
jgi:hypothetical protein